MHVNWVKPTNGGVYLLNTVDLNHQHFNNLEGVYIIYSDTAAIYVGSGEIAGRLGTHRRNFRHRSDYETLKVIWASVPKASQEGVELYLADTYTPIVGEHNSRNQAIPVNLPW